MRFYILRALVLKELHRHAANRGGIALGLLLIAAAVMLSVFNPAGFGGGGSSATEAASTSVVGGVQHCFVCYTRENSDVIPPLVAHLEKTVPPELRQRVRLREMNADRIKEGVYYQPGVASIRLNAYTAGGQPHLRIDVFHPPGDAAAMAPFENWLWREMRVGLQEIAEQKLKALKVTNANLPPIVAENDDLWAVRESFAALRRDADEWHAGIVPEVQITREGLGGQTLELRSAIATALVVFALYFACVYLLPTLNCEERERGVLLAQALSPASPAEILMAKFLFYPVLGGALAAVIAGIYKPAVLSTLFFWSGLFTVAAGFLGIGMTIATLAKTQRAAFMGAMCYLLSVSLVLVICSTNGIPFVSNLALEYHVPRVLHASLSGSVHSVHWLHLLAAMALAAFWLVTAGWLFKRRGWQ
ncbi:ABC transporter permease [Limnoglobus roseus]|uniref:ABC transporter permease n=2 Tax=Limnoglobus roseus TaxID=2598579 RepID=A0A5C1APL9_9BACT|nr:ABC transporter permease [Limnoglobus roseus]